MGHLRRTRETIVEGIYKDAHGISVIARLGSKPNLLEAKARFPLVDDDGIPYSKKNSGELIKCRLQLLEDLRRRRAAAGSEQGTVGATIDAWKIAFPLLTPHRLHRKRQNDHINLGHWRRSPIATEQVTELKRSQIRAQLQAWTNEGRAASTVNHRKHALIDLLRWALGKDDDDDLTLPTDGIAHVKAPEPEGRGIPMPILARIIATMPDRGRATKGGKRPAYSETKIRLGVMAWTGLAHMSLERLVRTRIHFGQGKIFYPARKKGKGAPGLWVDLLPPALEWLRAYDRAGLWGKTFSRSSMHGSWRTAVKNTRAALVAEAAQTDDLARAAEARVMLEQFDVTVAPNCYPYDTRHSFLTDAYEQSGDIDAVQNIGQHADVKTTQRYTKRAVPARVAAAIDKMRARWFPEAPKPGATVRDFHVVEKG